MGGIFSEIIKRKKQKAYLKNTRKMIDNKDYTFLLNLDNEQIMLWCDQYECLVEELFKLDFNKGENFTEYIVNNYSNKPYVNKFMSLLLKYNVVYTLNNLISQKKDSSYLDKIIDLNDYEENSNILINNVNDSFFEDVTSKSLLYETFLYTISFIKKDYKQAFFHRYNMKNVNEMSKQQVDIFLKVIKDISFDELPRDYLSDEKIIGKYVGDEDKEFALKLLKTETYDLEDELKLLEKLNSSHKTIEEEIVTMYKNNVDIKQLSLYQVLLVEMYARKKLIKNGVGKVSVNMCSSYIGMKGKCSYRCAEDKYLLDVNKNYPTVTSFYQLMAVLEHEVAHVLQEKRRINMDVLEEEDIDLYSKDHFIRSIANCFIISEEYYEFNYNEYSEEYTADITAYFETSKMLKDKNICYQDEKYNSSNSLEGNFVWDVHRFFYQKEPIHINDLFEDHLNSYIKAKKEGIEAVEKIMKKEVPLLLFEYDIYKENIPRRRTIKELLEIMKGSQDKKTKQVCLCLLMNRFNEFKEKKEDVERNVIEVKELLDSDQISEALANLLLSSRKRASVNKNKKSYKI